MRAVTDAQVRNLMEEMSKHGAVGRAAMKADMDRKTARMCITAGQLPSALEQPRQWRTRPDLFTDHWPMVLEMLRISPTLEANTIFEELIEQHPLAAEQSSGRCRG